MNNRLRALLLILLFVVLGLAYSLIVPPFETPDEPFHYAFARHIAQGNSLPVQTAEGSGPWQQEGSQAPLYYLLTGWLTRGVAQDDFSALAVRNPRANIGDPLNPGNKNFMLYSGKQPPMAGSNLALHLGRWFSLLLGALTLWFTFLTAQLAFPDRRDLPLLAVALVALVPQFAYLSGSFTNDTLVVTASAATVYWLARLLSHGDDTAIPVWEWLMLGILIGVAGLSKLQGLGLIPLAGLTVLFLAWQRRTWRLVLVAALAVGIPALAIAGWWYWRNIMLYGDWSGLGHLMDINGRRNDTLEFTDFWPEFRGLRYSFWGLFGWFNILLPAWFYAVMDILTILGGAGLVGAFIRLVRSTAPPRWRSQSLRVLALLVAWLSLMVVLLLYWISQATGSQGRLLYPAIGAIGILLATGLDFWLQWLPQMVRRLAWTAILLGLLSTSIYVLVQVLPTSYQAPAPIAAVPASAQPINLSFGDDRSIELLAVAVGEGRYRSGERVPVTLYLQARQPLTHDLQLFVQLLDEAGQEVANLTTHPGWGRNPTSFWQPQAIYADRYDLLVTGPIDTSAPLSARLYTGFINPATEHQDNLPLPALTTTGEEVTPFVARVALLPHRWAELDEFGLEPAQATWGDVIQLVGVSPVTPVAAGEQKLTTTLMWESVGIPATDYSAYVHVVDENGVQVAGYDQAPARDRFPTRLWQPGDRIVTSFILDLPPDLQPGRYAIWTGLYETASGGSLRLPVTHAGELLSGDGEVQLGTLEVQ